MSQAALALREDVEAHVEIPDFAVVAERGRGIRRRRTLLAAVAAPPSPSPSRPSA